MNAMLGHPTAAALIILFSATRMLQADGLPETIEEEARATRRMALVAELLDEGAEKEALAEVARLRLDFPNVAENVLAPLRSAIALPGEAGVSQEAKSRNGGIGGWFARRVVGFYRLFVGPALGNRCALEPSCSRYFLEASRRHGLLGIPMTADRFVREPVVSNSERRIRMPDGTWRHPDPVSDHDWWFSKEAK
jgi:hypothetical protein